MHNYFLPCYDGPPMKSMPNSHMRSVRFLKAFRLALFAVPAVFLLSFPSLAAQEYGAAAGRYTRSYYYDAAGKKIRCVDYSGSGEKLGELVYRHDSSGRLIEERHVNPAGETSDRAEITVSEGGEKLRTEVFVPGEAGEVLESYAVYEYDGSSRLTKTSIFSADGKLEWYLVHKWKEIDEGVTAE